MPPTLSKADLHLHTTYSDGTATIPELLAHVAAHTDLRVIAITDHNTIGGALEARQIADSYGIEVIVGEEVSTQQGHLLALFIEDELPAHRPVTETIAAAHAQGGICIAPHPYDWTVPSLGGRNVLAQCGSAASAWPIDAIEVFNASVWVPRFNDCAAAAAGQLALPGVGGSDAHHLAAVGMGYTLFPGHSAADLRHAIVRGQAQAGGSYCHVMHVLEFVALWLRTRMARALQPSAALKHTA